VDLDEDEAELSQRKARLKPSQRAALKSLRLAYEYGKLLHTSGLSGEGGEGCILPGCE